MAACGGDGIAVVGCVAVAVDVVAEGVVAGYGDEVELVVAVAVVAAVEANHVFDFAFANHS